MKTKTQKHTPGPWDVYAGRTKNGDRIIIADSRRMIDDGTIAYACDFNRYDMDDEADANARLIAAAPELLEAAQLAIKSLEYLMRDCGVEEEDITKDDVIIALKAAIAKAEGKEIK